MNHGAVTTVDLVAGGVGAARYISSHCVVLGSPVEAVEAESHRVTVLAHEGHLDDRGCGVRGPTEGAPLVVWIAQIVQTGTS